MNEKHRTLLPLVAVVALCSATVSLLAQTASSQPSPGVALFSSAGVQAMVAEVKRQAETNGQGGASKTLATYSDCSLAIVARTATSGAEIHRYSSDNFVVLDGDATLVTGGSIPGERDTGHGEIKGAKVVGGQKHYLKKGDIFHVSAGTPHQTVMTPGHDFVFLMIKALRPEQP
jgi:mannose-6-phosphate isomerase-like protein (cupin superfamily)